MNTDILTVDEFATRMHLSRATVFNWMQKGILARGKHYLKQGRVLRFIWNDELIRDVAESSLTISVSPPKPLVKAAKESQINWEY